MDANESTYISALKEGSYDAFTEIYNRYADKLYSFAIAQTKNKTLSQDIVQDTFMRFWNKREVLDCNKNIQALLFTMARHQIIDTMRKQIVKVEFEEYLDFCDKELNSNSTEHQLYFDEFLAQYKKSKGKLTARQCEIFDLSRNKNMTIKNIAEYLNLSTQTVKNHITTSLKIFRESLLKEYY